MFLINLIKTFSLHLHEKYIYLIGMGLVLFEVPKQKETLRYKLNNKQYIINNVNKLDKVNL